MIGLTTTVFDIDGDILFYNNEIIPSDSTHNNIAKRVTKIKTLDTGVYISDEGYTPGDTDIKLTISNPTSDVLAKLQNLFLYHSLVNISTSAGNFLCVPQSLTMRGGNSSLLFSTKSTA